MAKRRGIAAVAVLAAVTAACIPRVPGGPHVVLPSGQALEVELADTPEKRALGYMFREHVAETEGMLFFMEESGFHSFWMMNCKVSLDIVWLDERWSITHIEHQVPPCETSPTGPCPGYEPLRASLYVLEMQAGMAAREGLRVGDAVRYVAGDRAQP
jgi:uncharacterized membrane protein (UPF0127 family)